MKPYIYILVVLLIGGTVGFYVGQRVSSGEQPLHQVATEDEGDRKAIEAILERQKEAYSLHDPLLLLRDSSSAYVETNAGTGESYGLERAIIRYHENFRSGKSVGFKLMNPEITILQRCAIVRGHYIKTSDQYEQEGLNGLVGQAVWLMGHSNGRWEISAYVWTEEKKQ